MHYYLSYNIINKPLEGTNAFIHIEAYFENNCVKHGLFQQINPDTNKSRLDTFGIFNNCLPLDPLSKVAKIVYEDDGKLIGIDLFKKDELTRRSGKYLDNLSFLDVSEAKIPRNCVTHYFKSLQENKELSAVEIRLRKTYKSIVSDAMDEMIQRTSKYHKHLNK